MNLCSQALLICLATFAAARVFAIHSPAAGAVLTAGQKVEIQWLSTREALIGGGPQVVNLDLRDGSDDVVAQIAQGVPSVGVVEWLVPEEFASSTEQYRIGLTDVAYNSQIFSGQFTIADQTSITAQREQHSTGATAGGYGTLQHSVNCTGSADRPLGSMATTAYNHTGPSCDGTSTTFVDSHPSFLGRLSMTATKSTAPQASLGISSKYNSGIDRVSSEASSSVKLQSNWAANTNLNWPHSLFLGLLATALLG